MAAVAKIKTISKPGNHSHTTSHCNSLSVEDRLLAEDPQGPLLDLQSQTPTILGDLIYNEEERPHQDLRDPSDLQDLHPQDHSGHNQIQDRLDPLGDHHHKDRLGHQCSRDQPRDGCHPRVGHRE